MAVPGKGAKTAAGVVVGASPAYEAGSREKLLKLVAQPRRWPPGGSLRYPSPAPATGELFDGGHLRLAVTGRG